jgi:glycosyltransferase involved in cell wall biosynthesis
MKKLIAVDSTALVRKKFDGISRYSKTLLDKFQEQYGDEYRLIGLGFIDDKPAPDRRILIPRRIYSGLFKKLPLDWPARSELGFYPNFVIYPLRAKKSVVVVHDLAYLDRPNEVSPKNRAYLEKFVPRSIEKSAAVVAVSNFTKRRLIEAYGVPADRITVVPNGVEVARFNNIDEEKNQAVKQKYQLPDQYILCFGSIEPRKNLSKTIEAYTSLDTATKNSYPLVLAGGGGWLNDEIMQKIEEVKQKGDPVITTGYIEDSDVPTVYRLAAVLLFPSLYEGFGLPILEAQASGTPVITSNISPMKDVAGSGALLVDPHKSESITSSLEKLLGSNSLRKKLVNAGLDNIQAYSWEESAEKLKRLFDKLSDS